MQFPCTVYILLFLCVKSPTLFCYQCIARLVSLQCVPHLNPNLTPNPLPCMCLYNRRKIRLIESNAKRCYLKKWLVKGLCALRRCLSVWGPIPSYDPILPPPFTHCICVYTTVHILTHTGEEGKGRELTREKLERGNSSQSWLKIPTWLTVSPVYKLYETPVKTTFRVWCLYSLIVHGLCIVLRSSARWL